MIVDLRALVISIAEKLGSKCCGADLNPIGAKRRLGSHCFTMSFECVECGEVTVVDPSEKVRLCKNPLAEDAEDAEDVAAANGERKRKRKPLTNARPLETVHVVLASLLSGHNYSEYKQMATAQNLPIIHSDCWEDYLKYLHPRIEKLTEQSIDLMRYCVVRYGETINNLVLTNDWFWLTRGHYSHNGTGTICDWKSGGILAYKHFCQRADKLSNTAAYEFSSKAMDAQGFGEMLDEIIEWMEGGELDDLMLELGLDVTPSLDGVILDGDASTDSVLEDKKRDKRFSDAVHARASLWGNYCSNMVVRSCVNHLAKNAGKKALEIGKEFHKSCVCPVQRTVARRAVQGWSQDAPRAQRRVSRVDQDLATRSRCSTSERQGVGEAA